VNKNYFLDFDHKLNLKGISILYYLFFKNLFNKKNLRCVALGKLAFALGIEVEILFCLKKD